MFTCDDIQLPICDGVHILGANLLDMIKCGLTSKFENTTPQPHDLYWHVGESCVAQFAVDNHWYRGEVKEVDLEKRQIKVFKKIGLTTEGWYDSLFVL